MKCGVYHLNPGEVSDRQLAPSKADCPQKVPNTEESLSGSPPFISEQRSLYNPLSGSPPFTSEQRSLYNPLSGSPPFTSEQRSLYNPLSGGPPFTLEQQSLYKQQYEEGHDLPDDGYIVCGMAEGAPCSEVSSSTSGTQSNILGQKSSVSSLKSSSSDVPSELLVLPEPQSKSSQKCRKPGLNTKAICEARQ